MSQNIVDYSGNPTGPQLMDNYLDKEQENRLTTNSGIQRPTYAKAGTFWINSSANPWVLYFYNGSIDVAIGTIGTGSSGTFTVEGVDDSSYVHKNGDEAIGGNKTFEAAIKISSDSGNKASYQRDGIEFFPLTTATIGGYIDFHYAGSTSDWTSRIIEDASGQLRIVTSTLIVPAVATSDNSNHAATTAYVKGQGYATTTYVTDTSITKANTYYDSATSTLYIG